MQHTKNELSQSSALAIWTDKGPIVAKYGNSGRSINVQIEVRFYSLLIESVISKCFTAFLPLELTEHLQDRNIMFQPGMKTDYKLSYVLQLQSKASPLYNLGVAKFLICNVFFHHY